MTLEKLVVIITAETKQLETAIERVKQKINSLDAQASKLGNRLTKSFSKSASGLNKAIKALSLAGLSAGLAKIGKDALSASSDLQEWSNVVEVAFGDASKQMFEFEKQARNQFGLDPTSTRKLSSTFKEMANGLGIASEAGTKMSVQLTGLASDMASFFNTTTDATMTALEGIFTGQTRALKQYGIVMNETTLEAFRMERGLTTAYSKMSEAQKVALRYNYVLKATTDAQNDFARTSNSWANQMRLLTNNWRNLITSVGDGLIKVLVPVVQILNKILGMAIKVVNAIAKVFGAEGIAPSNDATGVGNLADDADTLTDNLDNATDSAKKLKKSIMGFDELNVLQDNSDNNADALAGLGNIDVGDLDSYFELEDQDKILNEFEKFMEKIKALMDADKWEDVGKEFANVLNGWTKSVDDWITGTFEPMGLKWANRIARVLNGLIDGYDWKLMGKTFADGLNAIVRIANKFLETFDALNFGKKISESVYGWFSNVDWSAIGKFFANKLNYFIDIASGFFQEFVKNAKDYGKSLGDAFNAWVSQIHWDEIASAISNGLNSIAYIIQGWVDEVNWEQLISKVSGAFNNIFVNLDIEGIKNSISSLVNRIIQFLTSINWYKVGHTVGEMLSGVDWLGVFKTVKDNVIWPAFKGFWEGLMSDGKNFLIGTIGKIHSWFKESFWGPLAEGLLKVVSFATIGNVVLGALRGFFNGDFSTSLVSAFADSMNWVISNVGGLIPGLGAKFAKAFEPLTAYFNTSAVEMTDSFGGLIDFLNMTLPKAFSSFGSVLSEVAGPIALITGLVLSLTSSYGGLGGVLERIGQVFTNAWNNIKKFMEFAGLPEVIDRLKEAFGRLGEAFKKIYDALGALKPLWEIFFKLLEGFLTVVGGIVGVVLEGLLVGLTALVETIASVVEAIEPVITWLLEGIGGLVQGIIDFFADLKYQLIGDPIVLDMVNGIISAFTGMITNIIEGISGFVSNIVSFFIEMKDSVVQKALEMKDNVVSKFVEIKDGIVDKVSEARKNVKSKFSALVNDVRGLVKGKSDEWGKELFGSLGEKASQGLQGVSSGFNEALNKIASFINSAGSKIQSVISGMASSISSAFSSIGNSMRNALNTIANFGSSVASRISNIRIRTYASGGMPDVGQLFIANEAGPELVGKIGNQNAVANQNQIIEGIERGVYQAVSSAMGNMNNQQGGDIVIRIDSEDIARASIKGQRAIDRRHNPVVQFTG